MAEPTHAEIAQAVKDLADEVKVLAAQVAETKEMVATWNAVKTGGKALTWLAKTLAALFALWAAFKVGAGYIVEIGGKP